MRDTRLPKYKWWNKESKSMLGPELDENYKILTAAKGEMFLVDTSRQDEDGWDWEMDVVWLQYTGLKDRNGKDIYEGDIVQDSELVNGAVVFQEGCFQAIFSRTDWNYLHEIVVDVIGNIYENPELWRLESNG